MWSRNVNNAVNAMQHTHSFRPHWMNTSPPCPLSPTQYMYCCRLKYWVGSPDSSRSLQEKAQGNLLQYDLISITKHGLTASFSPSWHFQPWNLASMAGTEVARLFLPESQRLSHSAVPGKGHWLMFTWWPFRIFLSERLFMTQSQTLWSHTRHTCTRNRGLN